MSSKVLVFFAVLCLLGSCWGEEESTQGLTHNENIPIEPLGAPSDPDLNQDSTFWRLWKFWKWGRSMIKNVFKHSSDMAESASGRHRIHPDRGTNKRKLKNKRTTTRRDSSLITTGRRYHGDDYETTISTARGQSTARLLAAAESQSSIAPRPKGSVRKEVITVLFESMLEYIVDSWDVIETQRTEESYTQFEKTMSEVTVGKKKKPSVARKSSKTKAKSRSKLDLVDAQSDPMQISWWNQPDEKSIIRFKNGNVYEGNISMKCMNGEGRFQWADGTMFLGDFKNNEIVGKGTIKWKDDTWYSGDFLGNLRHGKGLYVDSRLQRSYTGDWFCGTKHGNGSISYSKTGKNSYDGDWVFNVRHGYGTREYCQKSGYQGDWDHYVREGNGIMIWPNHDYYKGEWQNGVMSGYGMYIWNTCYNNTMSYPTLNVYRGCWVKGQRTGYGILNFGFGLGTHYKGEFKENKKHGMGKLVTNNGLILKHKRLFIDDSIKPKTLEESCDKLELCSTRRIIHDHKDPIQFDLCDSAVGLHYHVEEAIKELDRISEIRTLTINEFIENNRLYDSDLCNTSCDLKEKLSDGISEDMIDFEINALGKAIKCYEKEIKDIYYRYATICNSEPINFLPILIRLYLWQFYYDCEMHEKGLTLAEIDEILNQNKGWLVQTPHGPFEKIYLWQFIHGLVAISRRLYAIKTLPGTKPNTIVATAFRYFMDNDVLPNSGRCRGYLPQSYGSFISLQALYQLYRSLGETHTVRKFLCAVNRSPHLYIDYPQPEIIESPDEDLSFGQNAYVIGDEMTFIEPRYNILIGQTSGQDFKIRKDTQLFNFGNLASKTIIKIIATIFPNIYEDDFIINLDIPMTFFEFFQAFIACSETSIRVKEEELHWREMFETSLHSYNITPPPPPPPPPPARPGTAATAAVATAPKTNK